MAYIPIPIETDPVDLAEEAYAYLEEQIPGWSAQPGNLDALLVESEAQIAGELRDMAVLVPDSIFEFFGETVLDIPPYEATEATGTTTWQAIDTLGYTVDAGTLVGVSPPASVDTYAFEVVDAFTFTPGTDTVSGVTIRALEAGAEASGLSGDVELLDPLVFVNHVTLDAPTAGGVDAEETDAYLSRLSDLLTLLSPRPILPQDFAMLVQRSIPEIARATAIDLYKADTQQANQPRCVTVVVVDENGNALSAAVKNEADALLQANREVNFLAYVIDPTYTVIDVRADVSCFPMYDPAQVCPMVVEALAAYLSPATWGQPTYGDPSGRTWNNQTTVRYLELTQVVNEVEGVDYVKTLTFGKEGTTLGTADYVMTGVAPLPRPSANIACTGTAET